jgi:hypothetical protein
VSLPHVQGVSLDNEVPGALKATWRQEQLGLACSLHVALVAPASKQFHPTEILIYIKPVVDQIWPIFYS